MRLTASALVADLTGAHCCSIIEELFLGHAESCAETFCVVTSSCAENLLIVCICRRLPEGLCVQVSLSNDSITLVASNAAAAGTRLALKQLQVQLMDSHGNLTSPGSRSECRVRVHPCMAYMA